jgi:pimeloyl-ACP methyl ester carboxylesterase/DNA-binding CsgD family transcriptional regulator
VEQEIHFCGPPGGRIAYAVVGQGPPLVLTAWWIGNIELQWRSARFRAFVEALARDRTVVRYDVPGHGLSDPAADGEADLESELAALEAVVDEVGEHPVSLFGSSSGGCSAIAFAARQPERVERLLLYGSYAHGNAVAPPEVRDALTRLVRTHWGLGSRALADVFIPSAGPEEREDFTRYEREAGSPEGAAELLQLAYRLDVRNLLPSVRVPTLVLHRRQDRAIRFALGRELAAAIPGATFVALPGNDHFPWFGDMDSVVRPVHSFLGASAPVSDAHDGGLSGREREILLLVAEGLSDSEIAERLVLSRHTVHRHVANIRNKLGQHSRAAAVAEAARLGLI